MVPCVGAMCTPKEVEAGPDHFPPGVPVSTGWDAISVVAILGCWQPLFRKSLCKAGISGGFDT